MQMTDMVKVPGAKFHPEPANQDDQEEQQNSSTMRFGSMKVFCGSASQELGNEIVDYICQVSEYNLRPGAYTRAVFSNENIFIKLQESVRGKDVYLVQTMASPVHDNFMEMLIMIDALKRDSAWRINLVVPYMSYTRSDKKDQPRVPISARPGGKHNRNRRRRSLYDHRPPLWSDSRIFQHPRRRAHRLPLIERLRHSEDARR